MSRNRFEETLSCIHISKNETAQTNNRLAKIRPLTIELNVKFQNAMNPFEEIFYDKSMIPFRGRVVFCQYVPSKRHRYGIKIFKLCLRGDYIWNFKVHAGKERIPRSQLSSSNTVRPLLGEGRTLCTDNIYTCVSLAHELNENQTHVVGTLRKK